MYDLNIYNSIDDLIVIKQYWEMYQNHPDNMYDYYGIILRNRKDIESPFVLVVNHENIPITIVIGRIEKRNINIKLGYKKLYGFKIKALVLFYKGIIGNNTDEVLNIIYDKLLSILRKKIVGAIYIDNISIHSHLFNLLNRKTPLSMRDFSVRFAMHWNAHLKGSYVDYLKRFSSKHRYSQNRIKKLLQKDFKGDVIYKTHNDISDLSIVIEDVESIVQDTYHRKMNVGFENNKEYNELIKYYMNNNILFLYIIYIKNIPSAFWLGVKFKDTVYFGLTGYRPEYHKYELGTIVLLKLIEDCFNVYDDIKCIDFGFGDAKYKQRFGTEGNKEVSQFIYNGSIRLIIVNIVIFCSNKFNDIIKNILIKYNLEDKLKKLWRRKLINK